MAGGGGHEGAQDNAILLKSQREPDPHRAEGASLRVHGERSETVHLTGEPAGLAALKAMQDSNREYLKFLIQEAKTVFEHHVDFKAEGGAQFRLKFDVKTGGFTVEKKP
jgi:hypothetical protein